MGVYLDLLFLQFIIVMITDVSGFPEDGLKPLFRRITGSKVGEPSKLFMCSLCQVHWTGLIYLILTGTFSLANYAYVLLLACLTPVTLMVWHFAVDLFTKMISTIYDYFNL